MATEPTYGSQPKPLGKFASVTEAARKMRVTRIEAKWTMERDYPMPEAVYDDINRKVMSGSK